MDKKNFKSFDIIEDLLYSNSMNSTANTAYEKMIIESMLYRDITLRDAMSLDIIMNVQDYDSIYEITDYLEEKLGNLNKVAYFMSVYTGQTPDLRLKRL